MRPAAADRHSRACTFACFDRDAKRKTRRPTGGRTKAAAEGSVVGGGALRAVVLSGRGCIKSVFFLSRRSPEPAPAQMGFAAAVA